MAEQENGNQSKPRVIQLLLQLELDTFLFTVSGACPTVECALDLARLAVEKLTLLQQRTCNSVVILDERAAEACESLSTLRGKG
jgi:hypothetical protein